MSADKTRAYLAFTVLAIAALLVLGLFFIDMPRENSNLINTALGFIAGWAGAIVSFYFGSSSDKKGKDDEL